MPIEIPGKCLVCLVGTSGSGKSTFGRKHFRPTEVLSSDFFRGLVCDDETDQSSTADAFACLVHVARARLRAGRLTVIDATNLRREDRQVWLDMARDFGLPVVAIVLDPGEEVCRARNAARPDRVSMPARVLTRQDWLLRRSLGQLRREGFLRVSYLEGEAAIGEASVALVRTCGEGDGG
ncbi:MAG: AAA family ATPase [Deltaproteobacteria bacterium]|jgi:predicted kinase|nr:AAA family ATPase [Deltaproteobacteria bacterium]